MTRKGLTFPEGAVTNGRVGTARIREQIGTTAVPLASPAPAPLTQPILGMVETKRSKYGNKKCEVGGLTFDSVREARRWQALMAMQVAGEISELERQVVYVLAPEVVVNGRKRPPLRYIADFVYERGGETVIEDAKGMVTEGYRIKRHLMAARGLEITEIR